MKEIAVKDIKDNLIKMISDEWMLVASGDAGGYNMMTASWGTVGEMWGKDVAVAFIRPQRYTYGFMEKNDLFTLSFYGDNKAIHAICGKLSGRDVDKAKKANLKPIFTDGTVTFDKARLTIVCKKLYAQDISPDCFIDKSLIDRWYDGDYHRAYYGEILKVLVND
jgi:flavin reductase (DIM6/NTAB) family NADH-FMN oxidoreductase RutF